MNKIIGVLLIAFLALPQLAFNQCNANPGSLSLENTSFCKGELIQPNITNNNTAIEFVNELIVLDEQGFIVQAGITNGQITGLDWGNYTIHNLNYEAANPPSSLPVVGSKLTDIQDPNINCFDISTALNISITDLIAPVAVCSTDPIELYLDVAGELNVAASDLDFGSFDDGCLKIDTLFLSQDIFDCTDLGSINVDLTVRDSAGNQDVCATNLILRDTFPPTIVCQSVQVELGPLGFNEITASQALQSVSDACDDGPILSLEQTVFTCDDLGTQMLKVFAEDRFQNRDSCLFELTVVDTTGPIMECQPGVAYLTADGTIDVNTSSLDNGSNDLCGGALQFQAIPNSFDCDQLGVKPITLIGLDQFGNESRCQTNISILDTVRPKAICLDQTVYLDGSGQANITVEEVDNSTDNCTIVNRSLNQSSFVCSDLESSTIELTIEDFSGNSAKCEATITVLDTISPTALCKDVEVYLDESGDGSLSAVRVNGGSTDNCNLVSSISLDRTTFTCTDLGRTSVLFTALDPSGNQDTCFANVTVLDTISPILSCVDTTVYLDENGLATIDENWVFGNVSDNCPGVIDLTIDVDNFNCTSIGEQAVELTAKDVSGNERFCISTVTVADTIAPEISCAPISIYTDANGLAVLDAVSLNDGSFDICSDLGEIEISKSRFTCGDLGDNEVTLYVADSFGNIDSCSTFVTVIDTIAPQVNCKPRIAYLNNNGRRRVRVNQVDDGSFDNCGVLDILTLEQEVFRCDDLGVNTVHLIGEDPSGNKDTCDVTITVLDTIRPQANCRDFELMLGPDGEAILTPDLINNLSEDNCESLNFSLSKNRFFCSDLGPNEVYLRVRDDSDNLDSCMAIVTVVDLNKPIIFTKNIEVNLGEDGQVKISPEQINDNSTDNCTIDSLWLDKDLFDCDDIGENLVTLFIKDTEGNTNDEAAVVKVSDISIPTLECPVSSTINTSLDGSTNCGVVIFDDRFDPVLLNDNCKIDTFFHSLENAPSRNTLIGQFLGKGTTKITWVAKDANGLEQSCSFEIMVRDNEAPIPNCKDTVLVNLDPLGLVTIDSATVDNGSFDPCGIELYDLEISQFTCEDVGYNTINITMQDAEGNSSNCDVVIGIVGSEACAQPLFKNTEGPEISDPCSCRGNGAFDEEVVIGPTTKNQVWTVKSGTLLDPLNLQPYAVGTPFKEIPINGDSSIYTLQGVHMDGEGYIITAESPTFEDLSISNICYYPELEILGLDGSICLFTENIPLEARVANNVSGGGSFFINGQAATEVNPMELGVGKHIVTYTFNAGNPASLNDPTDTGCSSTVTKEIEIIETSQFFACNDLVSVTTNVSCEIEVVPQMILSGDYLCYDDYQVLLALGDEAVPNPVPAEFAGEVLRALVQHKPSGRICFGNIWLRDVTGPQITECPPDIVDRFICADLDSILNNPETLDSTSRLFTGIPDVEDNCTGTIIDFSDFLVTNQLCDPDGRSVISRRFSVRDQFGNESICEQLIHFNKPDVVYFPTDTIVREDCNAPALALDQEGNLSPSVSGAPFVINGFGDTLDLVNNRICGFLLDYDDISNDICAAQTSILRTWVLFDECLSQSNENVQFIQVGDFDPPIISCPELDLNRDGKIDLVPTYSTTAFDCFARIDIPQPVIEECSAFSVDTRIYTWKTEDQFGFPLLDSVFTELEGVEYNDGEARNIPLGRHFFIFTVRDVCNNISRDTCLFKVTDQIRPVVICEDDLNISLSSPSLSRVFPSDVDKGSRDNCDDLNLSFEMRRLVPVDCSETDEAFFTDWAPFIDVDCCDAGKLVTVELRVTDQSGNQNNCTSRLRISDNIRPICIAPFNVSVDCDELPGTFDPTDKLALQNSFGVPAAQDNCEADWEELDPIVILDQCKIGTITRRFQVTDNSGNKSFNTCEQVISVSAVYDYSIKFPADTDAACGEQSRDSIEIFERGCDMLAINIVDNDFQVSPEGCFTTERRYRVINWCEYDGISDPIVISRDADCDGEPGDEDVWVHVTRDGETYIDRNNNPLDSLPDINTKGTNCDGNSNPHGYWIGTEQSTSFRSIGYWEYKQFINVIDDVAPEITFSPIGEVCSENDQCTARLSYPFQIDENCTPTDINIDVIVDLDNDGLNDYAIIADSIIGTYPNFRINGSFPIGSHKFILNVSDGCGNTRGTSLPFTIIDCKAPVPVCNDGVIVELSRLPQPIDLNGDQIEDLASAMVNVDAYIVNSSMDCTGPVFYSINRVGESPDANRKEVLVTCDDEGIVLVEVHAWDQIGNHQFCQTFIDVQNNRDVCREIPKGAIYGIIATEQDIPVANVEVQLSGGNQNMVMSQFDGAYTFLELEEGNDFTVTPSFDINDRSGVTTFDLILIRKHILGTKLLDTPYKILAADANNSKNISVLDLIQLQKLILGIDIELSDNDSWRFVDANFEFPDPTNPWLTGIPRVININNLDREYFDADFVAVKIGDVNNSVNPDNFGPIEGRTIGEAVILDIAANEMPIGETMKVPVFLKDLKHLEGFQLGLQFDEDLIQLQGVDYGQLCQNNFGVFTEYGLLTLSWYGDKIDAIELDKPLFTMEFTAKRSTSLKESIRLSSRVTQVEAYPNNGGIVGFSLRFPDGALLEQTFDLYQNRPNPVVAETYIDLFLPEKTKGQLRVYTQNGIIVRQIEQSFDAGKYSFRLTTEDLPTGVLYYRFESDKFTATKKMVVIR